LIASAALALAASRYAYSNREFALASRLAAEHRQHILGAHSLAATEAKARPVKYAWDTASPADTEQDDPQDDADDLDRADDATDDQDAVTGLVAPATGVRS
jgi:hypothetical protein